MPAPVAHAAPRSASRRTSATGTCERKIDSQPRSCVRMPPAAGPSAAPSTPAATQTLSAASSLAFSCERRSSAAVTIRAAPRAWTQRAPTRTSKDGARPQVSDAAAKTTTPHANASRGRRRDTYAAGTATSASTRLKDVSTHATDVMPTSNWPRISGSASVTIDESASASPTPSPSSPVREVTPSRESGPRAPRSARPPHAGRPRAPTGAARRETPIVRTAPTAWMSAIRPPPGSSTSISPISSPGPIVSERPGTFDPGLPSSTSRRSQPSSPSA